ncbi:acyl-CoA dehydrogenase, partial [Pseudomonas syringae]
PVALLVPKAGGGLGANAREALHVQLALGALSPSLAVASTMRQFSVASLVAVAGNGAGAEGLLLSAIAQQRLLLASGFAEGVPGGGILDA